jgi:hypothetical protein
MEFNLVLVPKRHHGRLEHRVHCSQVFTEQQELKAVIYLTRLSLTAKVKVTLRLGVKPLLLLMTRCLLLFDGYYRVFVGRPL